MIFDSNKDKKVGVADGARTHDNRNHNPGLYQLSYSHHYQNGLPDRNRTCNPQLRRLVLYPIELRAQLVGHSHFLWSGWRDSNSRHPAPKAGALPDCATPRRRETIACKHSQVNVP